MTFDVDEMTSSFIINMFWNQYRNYYLYIIYILYILINSMTCDVTELHHQNDEQLLVLRVALKKKTLDIC